MDIVVSALSAMVDALPGKLGALLEQEYALLSGVRGDVVFLQAVLSSMRAAIHHCESLDDCDPQTRDWINLVRELAYDIDDWVDLFAIRVDGGAGGSNPSSSRGFKSWIRRSVDKLTALPERHAIAAELQGLKTRVLELSERQNRYNLGALPSSTLDPRLSALYVDTISLVGLDGPVKQVSKMVTEEGDMDLKVISIVGMVGSGKTTLAAAVYRQLQQHECFHCYSFVSVGQEQGSLSKTLKNMLRALLGYMPRGGEDIAQLIRSLRDTLHNKRYLIVVDDLWSREQWITISTCFPKNKLGSRIITTARDDELTKDSSVGSRDSVYKIDLLSNVDSKNLFLKRVFGTELDCPPDFEDSCAEILRRCGGLPLAIVTVASILAHRPQTRDEWMKLASTNSLWSSRGQGMMEHVLNRCLNDLVPHLRTCMLYLSIFPEYYEVEVERLVRRWVAEGFIGEGSSSRREETARHYINNLIIRNMVQPLDVNHDGFPRYCKIHPVIHDFIVWKSMEENFVTLVDDAQAQHNQYVPSNNRTVRRLSVQSSSKGDQPMVRNESTDLSHARSITVFGDANATPSLTVMKVVRVLDLDGCRGPVCLDGLSKLLLLRYLSLKGTDINELPEAIGDLRCLETLDVRFTKVEKLPISIFRLQKLNHLLCGSAKLPSGMVKMKALQTLSCTVVTQSCAKIIQEISRHDELRELELFCVAEMPEVKHRVTFPHDGFKTLKQLRIHCSLASVVTFEPNVLPRVEVLELMFEGGRTDESSAVSGIENLPNLKYVLLGFFKLDAGAMATVDAVRNAADMVGNNCVVSVKVSGESYY